MSGLEELVCSLDTDLNYMITMLQLDVATFWVYSHKYVTLEALSPGSEVLC